MFLAYLPQKKKTTHFETTSGILRRLPGGKSAAGGASSGQACEPQTMYIDMI